MAKKKVKSSKNRMNIEVSKQLTDMDGTVTDDGYKVYKNKWIILIFGLLFLYAVFYTAENSEHILNKTYCVILLLCLLFISLQQRFKDTITKVVTPVAFTVLAYTLVYAISSTYAVSGKFAISELCKIVSAFAIFIILSIQMKKDSRSVQYVLFAGQFFTALLGLLSIDAASVRLLSAPFIFLGTKMLPNFAANFGVFEAGTRIKSVLNIPNVFASIMALGVFLGIYLLLSSTGKTAKKLSAACLIITLVALILSFSLGTLLVFIPCTLICLLFLPKEKIAQGFIIVLLAGVLTFICAFVCFQGFSQPQLSFLPLTATVITTLLYTAGIVYMAKFEEKIKSVNLKKIGIIFLVLITCVAAFFVLAFSYTAAYDFKNKESIKRSFYPDTGVYNLTGKVSGIVKFEVITQSLTQTMTHEETKVLTKTVGTNGSSSNVNLNFDVEEGTKVAYISMSGNEGSIIEKLNAASNGKIENIPLKYPLIPGFIANRLQGLWANENAIQRFVFFRDGLKLYEQSPLLGLGPGGFESQLASIQDFYYETKYVHNHYIQILLESGILGFLSFVSIALCSLWVLLKNRKKTPETKLAFAPFLACVFLMFGHAFIEVDFSISIFIIFSFALLAVLAHLFDWNLFQSKDKVGSRKTVLWISRVTAGAALLFMVLIGINVLSNDIVEKSNHPFAALETAMLLDPFQKADYQLAYVTNSVSVKDNTIREKGSRYAANFENSRSNTILKYISKYYFSRLNIDKGFEMSRKHLVNTKSNPNSWQEQFTVYEKLCVKDYLNMYNDQQQAVKSIVDNIQKTEQMLTDTNTKLLVPVELTEDNKKFLEKVRAIEAEGYDLEVAKNILFS